MASSSRSDRLPTAPPPPLAASFPDYRRLVELVQSIIDAKPDDTAVRLLARKARRMGLAVFAFGTLFVAGSLFTEYETREKQRTADLLSRQGVPGTAEIVRRFVAPNGVTKRLEYRVAQSGLTNVEVHPAVWDRLEQTKAKTVPVVYVPSEPDISRLVVGQIKDEELVSNPGSGHLLAIGLALMGLFFLGFAPVAGKGYDLAFDNQQRAWKLKRYGRVVWVSKGGAGSPRLDS